MTKRIISMLLILTMLISTVPTAAFAETPTAGDQSSVDTGELTLEGTNSFGTLLTEDITEQQEQLEEAAQSGYTVTDLVIEDDTAIVTYDSLEEATLVVALYTEDGMELITSGTTTVLPEDTTAFVTFEGEMPQYFMASAYLLDTYDFSPLCTAYDTPMYTKEMQDLLASTVEDYDSDRVLNLDDSTETNFAVYAEDTIVIEYAEGVNIVTSADDNTSTYVITNADSQITSLKKGNVFVYPYTENQLLIVKVDTITISGTTATITGTELEMEEAFSHVKIDGTSGTEEMTVDDTTAAQGITYEGLAEEEIVSPVATFALEGGDSKTFSHEFKLDLSDEYNSDYLDASYSIKGSLKLQATVSVKYYVTLTRQYLEFKNVQSVKAGIYLNGTINVKLPLGSIGMSPVPGVYVGFDPKIVLGFTGEVEVSLTLSSTVGIKFDRNSGVKNISTNPDVEFDFSVEGTLFFGIDFDPNVKIVDEHIAKLGMTAQVGVQLKAKATGSCFEVYDAGSDEIHTCEKCIDIDLTFKAELSGNIKFLGLECLTVKITIGSWSVPLGNAYYSVDKDEFGFGSCPNRSYRVSILVEDLNDQPYADAEVSLASGEVLGKTNRNGVLVIYMTSGYRHFKAILQTETEEVVLEKKVFISSPSTVTIKPFSTSGTSSGFEGTETPGNDLSDILDALEPSDYEDKELLIASGDCGDGVNWDLHDSGTLKIYGTGAMDDYSDSTCTPWYNHRSTIKHVIIIRGTTSIGSSAFSYCRSLTSVTIPESVTSIGSSAFEDCTSLTSVTIPESVTSIGNYAFYCCTSLTSVTIPESVTSIGSSAFRYCTRLTSVTIPDGVTSIGDYAFYNCTSLTSVTIPGGAKKICAYTFSNCTSLTSVSILEGVREIDDCAFFDCTSLTSVTIPETVNYISDNAFHNCTSLTSVTIPKGVTSICRYAFYGCTSLNRVTIPESVTFMTDYAFSNCTSLTSVTIPGSVKEIGDYAFSNCTSLTSATILEGTKNIGDYAFFKCTSLTSVTIPENVTSIGSSAFSDCTSLTSVTIPEGVTSIGNYAFSNCTSMTDIEFCGDAPSIGSNSFYGVKATAYYPSDNTTWTTSVMQNYGGTLTWVAYTPGKTTVEAPTLNSSQELVFEENVTVEMERLDAVYGGEYGNETSDTYANIKTATFTDLVPGQDYILLALVSLEAQDPLGAENLLFIDQGTAAEDGTLEFKYVQRVDTPLSYVMACGASSKDLADAVITFPDMTPNGETQVVDPQVVYDGTTLEEGKDYVILGDVDFTDAGVYTCYIRGIYQYAGLVECSYSVMTTPTLTLSYPTLSFEDEINYNVYYTVDDITCVTEMGLMLLSSKDTEATIDDAIGTVPGYVTNGTMYLAKTEGIPAANMGDTVYFKVYAKLLDGSYAYSGVGGYNAKAYANTVLSGNYSHEMKSLVVAMVEYGTQAQLYFGHNTDALVDAALTDEQKALVEAYDEAMVDAVVSADSSKTANFVRVNSNFKNLYPSVSFDSAFSINFYCAPAITVDSGMTLYYWDAETYDSITEFTVDNATGSMEMTENGGQYWGCVPGSAAKDMDKTYFVSCVFESEGETITTGIIAYSLGKYCEGKAATDGDAQQTFAQATAVYGYYAKRYFASIA